MHHRSLTITAIATSLLAGGAAHAQSLIGDEFTWDFIQPFSSPSPETATVGPGPEFFIVFLDREYEVDIDESSITVTATATVGPFTDTWGADGTDLLAQIQITGLDFDDGDTISSVSVSGTAGNLDVDDVEFTGDSVFIGASLPNNNTLRWQDGQSITVELAVCPGPKVVNLNTGDEFVTIADAIAASSDGDTLELGPCTFFERGLIINDRDLTIMGAGHELTAIDGGGDSGRVFQIRGGSRVVIEGLTIRNASVSDPFGSAMEVRSPGTDVVLRDCVVRDCSISGSVGGAVRLAAGRLTVDRCRFIGNANDATANGTATDIAATAGGTLVVTNSLFTESTGDVNQIAIRGGASGTVVNNTFVGSGRTSIVAGDPDSTLLAANNVDDTPSTLAFDSGGATSTLRRNVWPGADGENIDGAPIFVDAANGDFRLAPGSPGIDAADFNLYVAAGGGLFDVAGQGRLFDDPTAANFDPTQPPIDAGAFERVAAANPTVDPCPADVVIPFGILDLNDIDAFIQSFQAGCP